MTIFQPQELCNAEKDGTAIIDGEVQVMSPLCTLRRRSGGIAPRFLNLGGR
jgi:hypothetical protein